MTAKKYTPAEAAQLRDQLIRDDVVPTIRAAFEAYPALQSATLLVAQFWCDEANDAVHCDLIYSELGTPDVEAGYRARQHRSDSGATAAKPSGWRTWFPWFGRSTSTADSYPVSKSAGISDAVNLPSGIDAEKLEDDFTHPLPWDSNGEPISLFAAFCREDCNQEMDEGEAFTPYAIFRRRNGDVAIDIVAVMTRPWLDGVEPQDSEGD